MNGDPGGVEDRDRILRWSRDRDAEAFALLIRRHEDALRRVAAAVLGGAGRRDPELLADSMQEGLRRLMTAFRGYRGESDPFVYMAAVVRRSCLDTLRRETRARGRLERAAALDASGAGERAARDPAAEAERSLEADLVLAALDGLGEPERSLVYLRDAEGASVAELARAFRLPQGTVKSKLSRGRDKLRRLLAERGILP